MSRTSRPKVPGTPKKGQPHQPHQVQMLMPDGSLALTPKYDAILNFVIQHPDFTHKQIAAEFGVSPGWIGLVVNTDAFKVRMKEKMDLLFIRSMAPVREKLHSLAHQALDQMAEALENTSDPEVILEALNATLDRIGYPALRAGTPGNATGSVQNQQNIFIASPNDLARARAVMERVQDMKALPVEVERADPDRPTE